MAFIVILRHYSGHPAAAIHDDDSRHQLPPATSMNTTETKDAKSNSTIVDTSDALVTSSDPLHVGQIS